MNTIMKKRVIALSTSLVMLGSAPLVISAEESKKPQTDQLRIAQGERGTSYLIQMNLIQLNLAWSL